MSHTAGKTGHRFSRRKLLLGGVAALAMAGIGMVRRGFSQQASNTSLEPTRSSLPDALFLKGNTLHTYRGHASAVFSVGWSSDGTTIASGSTDTTVQVWDARTARHDFTYRGHAKPVLTVAWSPDGKRIVSGCGDTGSEAGETTVEVWDAFNGRCLVTLVAEGNLRACTFCPDGGHLIAGGYSGLYFLRLIV